MKNKQRLIGTAYINIIDADGEIKFEYGYELDKKDVRLNDLAMFLSFLTTFQSRAEQDFKDRVDVNEKEWSVEKE